MVVQAAGGHVLVALPSPVWHIIGQAVLLALTNVPSTQLVIFSFSFFSPTTALSLSLSFFSLVCNLIFSLCSETIEPKRTRHFEVSYHRPRRLNPMGSLVVESSSLNALTLWMTLVCCQFSFPFPFSHFPCPLIWFALRSFSACKLHFMLI